MDLHGLERDWEWLPEGLLASVLEHLPKFCDFIRFCSVCQRWRLFGSESDQHNHLQKLHILKTCRNQLPMLMAPTMDNNKEKRSFYNVTDGIIYDFPLPVPYGKRCFGSAYGWLFTIDRCMAVTLLNPFTNQAIYLPEFKEPSIDYEYWVVDDRTEYFVTKGILSADPSLSPNNYEVAVIYRSNGKLAIYKSGDEAWTFLNLYEHYQFNEIIYHDRQLYGVGFRGGLMRVDVADNKFEVIIKPCGIYTDLSYLVSSKDGKGDLLLVRRFTYLADEEEIHMKTSTFKIYKLSKAKPETWVQVESIGNQVLFLGDNHSLLATTNYPMCKSNCIYYVDHEFSCHHYISRGIDDDTGIFNLEDGSFDSHYISDLSHLLPLIWIVPNFKEKPIETTETFG